MTKPIKYWIDSQNNLGVTWFIQWDHLKANYHFVAMPADIYQLNNTYDLRRHLDKLGIARIDWARDYGVANGVWFTNVDDAILFKLSI